MCSPLPKGQGYGSLQMTSWVMNQTKRTESAINVWIDQFLSKPMESVLKWKVVFPIQSWQINSYILVNYEILFLFFLYLQVWFLCILCTQSSVEKELGAEMLAVWAKCYEIHFVSLK